MFRIFAQLKFYIRHETWLFTQHKYNIHQCSVEKLNWASSKSIVGLCKWMKICTKGKKKSWYNSTTTSYLDIFFSYVCSCLANVVFCVDIKKSIFTRQAHHKHHHRRCPRRRSQTTHLMQPPLWMTQGRSLGIDHFIKFPSPVHSM